MLHRVFGGPTARISPLAAGDEFRGTVVTAMPMREGGRRGGGQPLHLRKTDGELHLADPWTDSCLDAGRPTRPSTCTIIIIGLCAAGKSDGFAAAANGATGRPTARVAWPSSGMHWRNN